jgi:hypothetical protein
LSHIDRMPQDPKAILDMLYIAHEERAFLALMLTDAVLERAGMPTATHGSAHR